MLATDSDEPRTMLGQALILTHCGKAQFTNLQIQTVGSYKLLFSATFLSTKETTNLTSAFQVPAPLFRSCQLCEFLPCAAASSSIAAGALDHCARQPLS